MYATIQAKVHKERPEGTYFVVLAANQSLTDAVSLYTQNGYIPGELRLDDGRTITADQRKRTYATLADIAEWCGDAPESIKELMKYRYVAATGRDMFSLSDCSVTTARLFLNFLIDFCMEWNVPLYDTAINRTGDINAAVYSSLKHRRCIVCGKDGDIHHTDVIGMGRDRAAVDDSKLRKMCLCREHHTECHTTGQAAFDEKYHCYGIIFNEGEESCLRTDT